MFPKQRKTDPFLDADAAAMLLENTGAVVSIGQARPLGTYLTRTVQFAAPGNVRGNIFCHGKSKYGTYDPPRMGAVLVINGDERTIKSRRPESMLQEITTIIKIEARNHVHFH